MRRHQIKLKRAKELIRRSSEHFAVDVPKLTRAESVELDGMELLVANDVPMILMNHQSDLYIPFLGAVGDQASCPSVTVDMGAVPYVVNGADVMVPGIVATDDFGEGDVVCIKTEKHQKIIAVGRAIKSSEEIQRSRGGKGIENLHYIGDRYWTGVNELFPR